MSQALETNKTYTPPEVEEFANRVGDFIEFWGFKHVQGRIWAHMYLTKTPMDAAEIMRRLQISKGLVSISLKEMMSYEVVRITGKSENGTILYEANPDQETVILNVIRKRERLLVSKVSAAFKLVCNISAADKDKLSIQPEGIQRTEELISITENCLDSILHSGKLGTQVWKALMESFTTNLSQEN